MKPVANHHSNSVLRKTLVAAFVGASSILFSGHSSAIDLYWETTSGTWSAAATSWSTTSGGSPTVAWTNGRSAIIEATSATMTLGASVTALNFTDTSATTLINDIPNPGGSRALTVTGTGVGSLTLSGSMSSANRLDLVLNAGVQWTGSVTLDPNLGATKNNATGNRLILNLNSGGSGLAAVNNGGIIVMIDSATIGSLSGTGSGAWVNAAAGTVGTTKILTISQTTNTTYAGVLQDDGGTGSLRALALVKNNSGRLRLTGTNTNVGTTTISGGALYVNGTTSGQGAYSVGGSATLGGTGSIGLSGSNTVNVADGGNLDPGDKSDVGIASVGTLVIGGATSGAGMTFGGTASIQFALGTTKDMITLTGSTMNGSASGGIGSITFDFNNTGAATTTTYDLISFGGTTQGIALNTFALSASSISAGWSGTFVYGGDGNTLQFAATSIPEPGAVLLCGLGLGSLFLFRKRLSC
ncbi:hypothetical protein BH09VER1_BH09VER1_47880 [soil metagenome]